MQPITSKAQMYNLLRARKLGNCFRSWTLDEFMNEEDRPKTITFRHKGTSKDRPCWYGIPTGQIYFAHMQWLAAGYALEDIVVAEGIEDGRGLQGEVHRGVGGLYLYYTHASKPMREALAEWHASCWGLPAELLLRQFLWPPSWDDLQDLLDAYPDHVIEFTAYDREVGWAKGRNTVIWEVRHY